jgi:S-adenosylmethionine synthetase
MPGRGMSFFENPSYLFTSESVTEGHPDKLCDQISDAVLDAFLAQDPYSRVACETAATRGLVQVMGEITSRGTVDFDTLTREVIRNIGYTKPEYGIGFDTCGVNIAVQKQSGEIATAVGGADADDPASIGAGDQGMMVGYACQEFMDGVKLDTNLMPLPIYLSHKLCLRLAMLRKKGAIQYLRPDGKAQVTVEYQNGQPKRIHTVVLSTQHDPDISIARMREQLISEVSTPVLPAALLDKHTSYHINPSGSFIVGGPAGDAGLTGRKILVDTYGGFARHGGGAFSGKDPTKVDRSAAYAARYVAKNVVAAGLADRAEVQVSYAIGIADPVSISVETFGTGTIPDTELQNLVRNHFDLRPGTIIKDLNLRRPIYQQTAAYGHFGRDDLDLPWEKTDRASQLYRESQRHQNRK